MTCFRQNYKAKFANTEILMRSILFSGFSIFAILAASPVLAQSFNITPIKNTNPINGTLDNKDGRLLEDNSFLEIYRFDATKGQIISASLISSEFDTTLSIGEVSNGAACEECGFATADKNEEASTQFVAKKDGPVYIRVNSREVGQKGKYTLTVSARDPNKVIRIPLEYGKLAQGIISKKDAEDDEGNLFDSYNIKLSANQKIQINLNSTAFDPILVLQGPDSEGVLVEISEDDDSGPGSNARIRYTVKNTGEYRVKVKSASQEEMGAYTLLLGDEPPVVPLPKPKKLVLGTGINGAISSEGQTIEYFNQADEENDEIVVQGFVMDVIEGKNYVIDVTSKDIDPKAIIGEFDSENKFEPLKEDDDGGTEYNAKLRFKAEKTGQQNILVSAISLEEEGDTSVWKGNYIITANEAIIAPTPKTASIITLAKPINDSLIDGGPRDDEENRLYKIYSVNLRAGQDVTLSMNTAGETPDGKELDTFLQIGKGTPASFEVLAEDDDSGKSINAKIKYTAKEAGTYLIRAMSSGEDGIGPYSLLIINTPPPAPMPKPLPLAIGVAKKGDLSNTDPVFGEEENHFDLYSFNGVAGQKYIIEVKSETIDSYLSVKPLAAEESAYETDDDGGEESNAKLEYIVKATGTQIIRVSSADSDEAGEYEVKISQ